MVKKKEKPSAGRIEVKQRAPGKVNNNFFGEFKQRALEMHPLDEMFPNEVGTHTENSANPQPEKVGSLVPTTPEWVPTQLPHVGTQEPTKLKVGTHKRDYSKVVRSKNKGDCHLRPNADVLQRAKEYCAKNNVNLSDLFDTLFYKFLNDVGTHSSANVGSLVPSDDRRVDTFWKTTPRIINLYLAYNSVFNEKSKWSVRDDDAGLPFNNVDIRLIELGILQTQANKGFSGKINSFGYYAPEIQNFIDLKMPSEGIDAVLNVNRMMWKKMTGRELDLSFLEKK